MADKNNKKVQNADNKVTQNVLTRGTLASRMINPELFMRPVSEAEFSGFPRACEPLFILLVHS